MEISIVIPAFNESKRLPKTLATLKDLISSKAFESLIIKEIIIVDDGSKDNTIMVAQSFQNDFSSLKILKSSKNFGKGHAVRTGLLEVKTEYGLVADADMSTPWTELNKLSGFLLTKYQIAIGSRDLPESDITTKQSFLREHLGKLFNIFVRFMTDLPFKDTQCGFKLFKMDSIKNILNTLQVNRFAWDVEFLYKAKKNGLSIVEVPIKWNHVDESRVHPIKDGLQMVWTVLKIKLGII